MRDILVHLISIHVGVIYDAIIHVKDDLMNAIKTNFNQTTLLPLIRT
jgi:hypothetical protein